MGSEPSAQISPIFLSDDISKWSPHMPVRVQQDSAEFWSEVFDEPWIKDIEKIDMNDTVIANIMGFKGHYKSNGANKEGSSGKRITYLMINLKAYSTAIMRGKTGRPKVIEGAVRLLTFLDDGLTQADVNTKNYKENALKVINGYRDYQAMCGYELKIAKSYPSDRYLTFLNYEYLAKTRLYDELKSCIKLFVKKPGEILTLPERLRECASWAVGATESGSDIGFVYYAYILRCVIEVSSWSKKPLLSNLAVVSQFVAPLAYGGFGVCPVHGIVAGLIRNLTSENMESLKKLASYYVEVRPIYILLSKQAVSPKRGTTIFKAPSTVTTASPHLTEHRITSQLEKVFLDSSNSAYLTDFIALSKRDELEDFADELVSINNRLTLTSLSLVHDCTTIAFIDKVLSKCKKSTSLINMLGPKEVNRVVKANIAEAMNVIDNWGYYIQTKTDN